MTGIKQNTTAFDSTAKDRGCENIKGDDGESVLENLKKTQTAWVYLCVIFPRIVDA